MRWCYAALSRFSCHAQFDTMKLENTIHSVLLQYYGGQNAHLFHRKGFFSSEFIFAASF
jgi:hypothetical protein